MNATIKVNMDNAAFEEEHPGFELARILRELADDIENGEQHGNLRDFNGNKVGTFNIR